MPVKKHCLICNGSLIPGIPFKSIYTERASNELPQGRHNKDSAPSVCPSPAVSSLPKRTSERSEPGGRTEAIMHTQPVPDGTSGAQRMLGDISLAVSSPTQRAMEDQLRHSGSGTLCNATPMLSHVLPPSPQVAGSIQQANYFSKHITPGSPHGAMPCHNVVASSPQVLIPGDGAVAPITHVAMSSEQAVAPATHMSMPSHQVLVPSPLVTMPSEQILVSNPRITMPNQQVVTQSPQLTMSSHDVLALNSHLTITGQKNLASTSHLSVSSQDLVATNLRLAMSSEQVLASNPHVAIQSAQGSINQLPQSPQVMVPNQQAVVLSEQVTALTHEVATPPPQHHNYQQVATPSSEHQQGGPPGSQQVSPPPSYPDLQLSSVRAHHQQVALQEYNPTLTPSYTAASVDPSVTLTPSYTAATPVPTVTQIQVMQANSEVLTSSTTTVGPTEPVMTMNQPPVVASTVHQALTVSSTAHHPLAVSATERHQLALTSAEPHQLNTTSAEHQPLITSTRHQPLTLTSIDHRPLIVKSTEHQHLAVTSTEHHQLAVTATEHPPLTVTSTEHHQLAVPSTEHQLAVTSTEHQPLSVTSTEHQPLTVPSTVNQHTPMTQQQSSGMLDGQSHHPAKEHLQHDYHHETYPEVSQAMTDTFMQLGTTMEQQLVNVPYVMPPVSTQASLTAAAQTMVTYVLPPVSTQTNPIAANVQTPSYDAYATNSVYTSAQWDHAVQSTGGISMDEVADRFTMSPTEQGSTSQSVPVRQAKGFQGGQEYILQGANVLRHMLMQQQQQAQHQVQVVSHHQSDIIETTPTPPQQSLPATMPPLISSQPRERTTTQAAVTKVKVFPAGVKQEKVEKISMPKETENKVKVEKEKGEKAAVRTKAIGKKDLSGELKDRLESALQLSLTGRVCHSPYVCQACEHKLSEVELYYKVVSEFRQSFFKTAHAHGIKDSDIAEGLTITTEQHTSPKNLLAGFLSQPPGGITGSSWQELISPGLLDSAISDKVNWGEKTLKMHQKEIPKVPSKTNEQKPVDKTGERLQPAVLPKKRGRPRKFPLPVKSEPVRLALPPRLKLPRREAKVRTVEPPLKRRKLLRVIRHKVTPPVEVDDGGTTEEDDTFAEIDDDPLDDDWKPSPGNKQPAIGDPLVRVKAEAVKVGGVKAEGSKVIDSKEQDDDLEADDSSTDEGDGDVKDVLASLAQHVKKPMYQCVICSKSFAGVTMLKFHIQKKHKRTNITEPYKCAACGETFESPSGVRLHVKMHIDERSRTCEVCEKSYGSVAALNLHIRNKHPLMRKRMGKFPCGKCGKRFSCIQSLQMHTRTQHEAEREVHTCTVCQRHFLDKERKVNHESKCEKDMEKLNLVRDMQAERSFICKICNASYKNKSAFKQHHYTHKDEKPHQCKVCESKFLYKKSLTDHVAAVHRGERRMKAFKCEVCGHGYSHAGDLAKHMTLHSGKFCCPTCNKPCAGSYKLKEHMRIHTGEKPYKCDVCSASFTQAAGLKSHQYTHKTNKRFLCTICGMQFAHRTTFRRHGMTHTGERPYKCSICNKGFQFDWVLKDHIKTHTGEKPHLCSICGKSFTQPQHLKTHLRIHTGEKPYRCAHCDVSYRHLSSYNQHKRNCPITGGANEKKEARAKARKIIAPSLVTSLQPAQLSTLQTADILAHLTRPSATYMTTDDPAINILDESHMHIPTHHSLIGPPSPPPHLTRVTLPETTTSIGSPNYQTTQSPQLHQSGRHLLEMGTLPQDLTQMQHAALQPASVGMQPMDMTSSGAALAMGTTQGQQQQQQQQHVQTVQTFNLMQTGYTQNYVH